jgi:hypothetical protein
LSLKAQVGNISYTEIANAEKKINETLKYLSDTIDDFRSFVSNGKNLSNTGEFKVCETIRNTIRLISIVLEDKNIDLILKLPEVDKVVK